LNGQMKPTADEPVTVDAADLDNNGTMDAILSYYNQGKSYPVATRDEILDQMPSFKTKFPTYASYCDATAQDIFNPIPMSAALHLEAKEFRSGVFINTAGQFRFVPFPFSAQAFPVRDMLTGYFRGQKDGPKDILLVGNNYAVRAQWGRQDAGKGLLLAPQFVAHFDALGFSVIPGASGFYAAKDARRMVQAGQFIIVANNNDTLQEFQIH
jgi:enediyne biosynthesis protein E4